MKAHLLEFEVCHSKHTCKTSCAAMHGKTQFRKFPYTYCIREFLLLSPYLCDRPSPGSYTNKKSACQRSTGGLSPVVHTIAGTTSTHRSFPPVVNKRHTNQMRNRLTLCEGNCRLMQTCPYERGWSRKRRRKHFSQILSALYRTILPFFLSLTVCLSQLARKLCVCV